MSNFLDTIQKSNIGNKIIIIVYECGILDIEKEKHYYENLIKRGKELF